MNKNKFIIFIACVGIMFSLVSFVSADSINNPPLVCSGTSDECDAKVMVGDKFSISLNSNPSTGYQWNFDFDKSMLQNVSSSWTSLCPSTTSGGITGIAVGCGQVATYNFTALKEGTVRIIATYSRSWESTQPAQTKYYNIAIYNSSIDGVCGSSNNASLYAAPASNLCLSGTASAVTGSGPWSWTCAGLSGGVSVSCSAQKGYSDYPAIPCSGSDCNVEFSTSDKFSISLEGNASTGYQWNLDYDTSYLQLDSSNSASLCPPTTSGGVTEIMVGCGQKTIYNFSILKAGKVTIKAIYSRTWESTQPAQIKHYNITITSSTPLISPACGPASNRSSSVAPTSDLCLSGTASAVTGSGPWSWTCAVTGGTPVSCSTFKESGNYEKLPCSGDFTSCDAKVKVGSRFSIVLEGNASTGYQWNLDHDKMIVRLDSSDSASLCPLTSGIDGCGPKMTYNFTALKEGTAKITATYSRSWESVKPIQTKYYNIAISASDPTVGPQKLGPITIDKPLNEMNHEELLKVLISLIAVLSGKR